MGRQVGITPALYKGKGPNGTRNRFRCCGVLHPLHFIPSPDLEKILYDLVKCLKSVESTQMAVCVIFQMYGYKPDKKQKSGYLPWV